MPIKIVIADDHKLFRAGMISILENFSGVTVIGEAENGVSLLNLLKNIQPDLILLDLRMPEMDGYGVLDQIKKAHPQIKAIVVSMFDSDSHIANAIEAGAKGYLHKNAEPEEVELAIVSVYENAFYFNEKTNKAMLSRLMKQRKLVPVFNEENIQLTDTEINILRLVGEEFTSEEIGKRVFLSKRRVETIRQELIKKIGVKNVVGLVLFGVRNEIITFK